jgi:hypothetical protein
MLAFMTSCRWPRVVGGHQLLGFAIFGWWHGYIGGVTITGMYNLCFVIGFLNAF